MIRGVSQVAPLAVQPNRKLSAAAGLSQRQFAYGVPLAPAPASGLGRRYLSQSGAPFTVDSGGGIENHQGNRMDQIDVPGRVGGRAG
jgi:hypothetical protein